MNHYTITLYNKVKKIWKETLVERYTFPEASMEANLTRCNLGFDWEIVSIHKNNNKGEGRNV